MKTAMKLFTVETFAGLLQHVGYDPENALHLARAAARKAGKEAMEMVEFLKAVKDVDRLEAATGRTAEE